jgi:hypothetical protein
MRKTSTWLTRAALKSAPSLVCATFESIRGGIIAIAPA